MAYFLHRVVTWLPRNSPDYSLYLSSVDEHIHHLPLSCNRPHPLLGTHSGIVVSIISHNTVGGPIIRVIVMSHPQDERRRGASTRQLPRVLEDGEGDNTNTTRTHKQSTSYVFVFGPAAASPIWLMSGESVEKWRNVGVKLCTNYLLNL